MVRGELGERGLSPDDIPCWDDQPLDVVVDERKHQVKIFGVEQLEISPQDGQMILDKAFAQVPIDRAGFVCHNRSLHRAVCSSPAEHCRVGITAHRGQRQIHDGGWQVSGGYPRCPDPQMLLLHSSPVAPLRRAPRAMV